MTYARSRLMLGISGVGLIVLVSLGCLVTQVPLDWLPTNQHWEPNDLSALILVIGCLIGIMAPLDFLGGYVLPNRRRRSMVTSQHFLASWLRAVSVQSAVFFLAGVIILGAGRWFGLLGAALSVLLMGVILIVYQLQLGRFTASLGQVAEPEKSEQERLAAAIRQTERWGCESRQIVLLSNSDPGFTGGVVGMPWMERIVLPVGLLKALDVEELAVTLARRFEATQDGSRSRGIVVAFVWVLVGFTVSATLPGAGVVSVAELAMTCLGFTLWTFAGLLVLPTLSRQASFAIDQRVIERGASPESLHRSISKCDRFQDDEPERPAMIEAIFHPVPSVGRRLAESSTRVPIAWHAARMTLFISWACMGTLVRAVHCNVGRPELWVMYPTD